MKKRIPAIAVRIIACILCTISVLVLGLAGVASVFYAEMKSESATYKEGLQKIADSYALYALNRVEDKQELDELDEFFESQGISCEITLVSPDGKKVKTDKIYSHVLKDSKLGEYQTQVVKGTRYTYLLSTIWSALGNSEYSSPDTNWKEFELKDYIYDVERGLFYYETEIGYFPVEEIHIYYTDDTPNCDYTLKTIDGKSYYYNDYYNTKLNIKEYQKWESIELYGTRVEMKHIKQIEDSAVVEKKVCKEAEDFIVHDYNETISCEYEGPLDTYIIQIGVAETAEQENYFNEWGEVCTFIYLFKDSLVSIIVVFFFLFLLGFVLLIYSTEKNEEELGFLHRVPVITYSLAMFLIVYLLCFILMQSVGELLYYSVIQMDVAYCIVVLLLFLIVLFVFIYLQNMITRLRTKTFLKYSEFCYAIILCKWSWKIITEPFKRMRNFIRENTSLVWKGIGVFLAIVLGEFILFAAINYDEDLMALCFIVFKCIEIPVLIVVLSQMKKLQEGAKRIASGDLYTPIDTKKMFWEFKSHGENINNVSQGIQCAVEKQMKSERFKTELITNVSHDIKTPLTSIINYVDLVKKENITDEKLCEYIEVLDRQSARLKKLIEDLMEASKASTGNLPVNLEECDIEVLLTQIVGEFDERLQQNQLEVIVDKPEHPVIVKADGRHMWRVLDNLLSNACKYALPSTRVYVSLTQVDAHAVIVFKNISKAALNIPSEELMERFVRGDSSRNTEGSGLGLSIAQSLTELMSGKMQLDIDGDLFKVTLRFPI